MRYFLILFFITHLQYNTANQNKTCYLKLDNFQSELIKEDLKTYNYLKNKDIEKIIFNMQIYSIKYNLPIGLLHSIFRIETEYKFWIKHNNDYAVGLGGVVWSCWKNKLIENNIAKSKNELRKIDNNIHATAFILRYFINIINEKQNDKFIIDDLIKYYYGAKNDKYYNKMKIVTSDLWLIRINEQITK